LDTKHYQSLTLVDVAYEALKKDIAEKTLQPGQKLIIRELHERYGISDTPIKQALNRLIIEGLVENVPRKGMKVKELLWEEIEELMDIRLMIETYYAKIIIQNFKKHSDIKEKLIDNLKEHMNIAQKGVGYSDFLKNYHLDQKFHQFIVRCSENSKIIQIHNNLGTHVYGNYIYGRQSREEVIPGIKEHEIIFNALVDGDEVKLRNALEAHIMNAKIRNRKLFSSRKV
jgi:DNA-binding GntR family transcriptional regulator